MTETSSDGQPPMATLGYTEQFTWGSQPGTEQSRSAEPPVAKRHWGKYRGTVLSSEDVTLSGRLLVSVPGIVTSNWAMPCVPFADIEMGTFVRPRAGANVWIEFERGDPDKPIWVGYWWGEGQIPLLGAESAGSPLPTVTVESATAGLSVSDEPLFAGGDTPGNVNVFADEGAVTIALAPDGVSITAPRVTITAGLFTVITPAGEFTVG